MSSNRRDKSFVELQKKWYKKLKDSGFEDIELVQKNGHIAEDILKKSDGELVKKLRRTAPEVVEAKLRFYRMITTYLAYKPRWSRNVRDLFIIREYAKGTSYRKIIKLWAKAKPNKPSFSVFVVFCTIKKFLPKCMEWNRLHEEGVAFQEALDAAEELEGGEA